MKTGIIILILAILTIIFIAGITATSVKNITDVCICDERTAFVTSEYNWFLQEYKTTSKCTICGLPLE